MRDQHSNYWLSRRRNPVGRRRFVVGSAAAGAGLAGLALTGCGDDDDDDNGTPSTATAPAAGTPVAGGQLRIRATVDIPQWNPNASLTSPHQYWLGAYAYNHLYDMVVGPDIGPREIIYGSKIFTDLPEQPDDATYLVRINKAVKWHDIAPISGRALDTEDIVTQFEQFLSEGSPHRGLFSAVDNAVATDDETVRITLKEPQASFQSVLGNDRTWLLPKEVTSGDLELTDGPIGTGPFFLEDHQRGSFYLYKKNPNYWVEGKPYLDSVRIAVIPDGVTAVTNFLNGQIDLGDTAGYVTSINKAQFESRSGVRVVNFLPRHRYEMIIKPDFDGAPFFRDPRVRRAIAYLIDQDEVIARAYDGQGERTGIFHYGAPWSLPDAEIDEVYRRREEDALTLLREAGFPDGNGIGRVELAFNPSYGALHGRIAEVIDQQRRPYIQTDVQGYEGTTFVPRLFTPGDHATMISPGNIGYDPSDMFNYLRPGTPVSRQLFADPNRIDERLTSIIARQETALDPEERAAICNEGERYLQEAAYAWPVGTPYEYQAIPSHVQGYYPHMQLGYPGWDSVWLTNA